MKKRRRKATIRDRLCPCECCGFPVSQRHHILPAHRYGEQGATVQFCATCHDAVHIYMQAFLDLGRTPEKPTRSITLAFAIWQYWGEGSAELRYLDRLIDRMRKTYSDTLCNEILDDLLDMLMRNRK